MTREEAIKFLEETSFGGKILGDKILVAVCDLAISAIRGQEGRRWIPVTEMLPETGKRVLATDGGFVGEFYINIRGQWQRYNVNDYSSLMALDILWWTPLPEPPKGE